jgi:hypothetical protein
MRKIYLLGAAIICAALAVNAQNSAALLKHGKLLRSPLVNAKFDNTSQTEKVVLGSDGSIYHTGEFTESFDFKGASVEGIAGGSTYVLKYSAVGEPAWGTSLFGAATPTAFVSDGAGGVVVAGRFAGKTLICRSVDGTEVSIAGEDGVADKVFGFIVRYNADGKVLYAKSYVAVVQGVFFADRTISINSLLVVGDVLYAAGDYYGDLELGGVHYPSGTYNLSDFDRPSNNDGILFRLDLNTGNVNLVLPFNTYKHTDLDYQSWSNYKNVVVDASGNIYLSGFIKGAAKVQGAATGFELPTNNDLGSATGLVIASYSAAGDYRWSKCFPMQLITTGYTQPILEPDGIVLKNNEVVVLGRVASNLDFSETVKITASDLVKSDYFLAGFSTVDGSPAWASVFGTEKAEVKGNLFSNGNISNIAGSYSGSFSYNGNALGASVSDSLDCFVASVEGNGVVNKFASYGGQDHDLITSAAMDANGANYFAGLFRGDGNILGTNVQSSKDGAKNVFDWYLLKMVKSVNSIAPAAAQSIKENENGAMLTVTEVGSATSRQWLFSTTSGSGYLSFATAETGTTYTPKFATAGVYYVVCESVVDGITGRSNEVAITVSKATGIDDVSEGKFKAFPNPSNGEITFSFPEAGGKLEIVDINGRVVYTAIVDALTTTVNISVASGMYMALLNSNGSVSKLKLVIR